MVLKRDELEHYDETRLFFVTDSAEDNEELFETLEGAQEHKLHGMNSFTNARIRICIVRNAYKEDSGEWNYEDYSNTFETVKEIE